jgi:hypothetical protein
VVAWSFSVRVDDTATVLLVAQGLTKNAKATTFNLLGYDRAKMNGGVTTVNFPKDRQ